LYLRAAQAANRGQILVSAEATILAGLAGRYATALFELARERDQIDAVEQDLARLAGYLKESDDLARLLASPLYSSDELARAIDAVMERAGLGELTRHFVGVVAKNRRLAALGDMIDVFGHLLARQRGEVAAEVVSAQPLDARQLAALKDALGAAVGPQTAAGQISLSTALDESLLGGLVVKLGSRMVDSSLRTKLNNLENAMNEVG
jgi:F-type H+-transporting ATPase subunit delta